MNYLNNVDYTVIVIYFSILIGMGVYLQKKASASMEDYFIGGRSLPWWALGISGMASWLDVTGTMIITSFLFMLGPRGLFIEFRGGAVLVAAVALLWVGKWHRRSQCITGAQWMAFRFGNGFGGQFARIISAVAAILSTVGMLAYMIKGIGLFLSMFLPFSPFTCALILIAVASIYTMASGFYGVVFTDIFQSGIVIISVILLTMMAFNKVTDQQSLAAIAADVTGNNQWISSAPHWKTDMPAGYECYSHLMMFAMFYLLRNIFGGMGGGAEPKYFGAKNDRECGTLTFLTIFCVMFRWPMMLAYAILGIFLVKDLFPDQTVMAEAAMLIKTHCGEIAKSEWATVISGIINNPLQYPTELVEGLKNMLGSQWISKLHLISFDGTVNPERILPSVVMMTIPMGLRGMILVALLAACMSTFDTTVNMATGFFTNDIYQRYIRPKASNRELISLSWAFIVVIVVLGFLFAYSVESINDIWGWIVMSFGGGLLIPGILRLYWWRFNGGGFAIGTAAGMIGAVVQRLAYPAMDERMQFVVMLAIGLVGSIIGTFLTKPTDDEIVENFYRTTRPFGFWGKYINLFNEKERVKIKKEHFNDIVSLPFALGWQITLFLLPMQLMVKSYNSFFVTLTIFIVSLAGMYWFWYRNLPKTNYYEDAE
ncbi:MAG: sodium:solute symporter [Sedimentisphaeraceae bacterium JB056]